MGLRLVASNRLYITYAGIFVLRSFTSAISLRYTCFLPDSILLRGLALPLGFAAVATHRLQLTPRSEFSGSGCNKMTIITFNETTNLK